MTRANANEKFSELLDQASQEDDLFADPGPALGSNPFSENEKSFTAEEKPLTTSEGCILDATISLLTILNAECSFNEFMKKILCVFKDAVPSEKASILELDYKRQDIFFRTVCNMSSETLLSVRIPFGEGVVGFVGENQIPLVLSNVDESAMYLASVQKLVGFEATNLVAFPIVIRGRTFGIIELFNREGATKYNKKDQDILAQLASIAAKIIENRLVMAALSKSNGVDRLSRAA